MDDGRIGERCGIGRFYEHRVRESLSGEPCRVLCGVTSERKREYGEVGLDAEHGESPGSCGELECIECA